MTNGNGKMASHDQASVVLEGQRGFNFLDPTLAQAIAWLRRGKQGRHHPGCQCQPCAYARPLARAAVRVSTCDCGWCPVCWLRAELAQGRL